MRALIALALLLAAPVGGIPGTGDVTLAADSERDWVAFTLTPGNQIRFTVSLDGQPAIAVLDTGATETMLSQRFADRTRRTVTPRGRIVAIGGSVASGWTAIRSLAIGGLLRTGGGLSVIALPGNATGTDEAIDLLIGRDLIQQAAIDIDYAGRRFRFLRSGRMPFTGIRLPLGIGIAPQAYVTEISVAGRVLRPIIVDTGDGTSLTLARSAWRTVPFSPPPTLTTQLAYGVGGPVEAEVATLPEVGLGAGRARDVSVWIEPTGGFSDGARSAGRIGMGLLQRYHVLLDPGAGHMVLAPGAAPPPPQSTSGLQLAMNAGRLDVFHVMRGSPAAATGWRVGDSICAVDGVTIASDPAAAARATWPFGAPGTEVSLGLCDGRTRTLTLRRFY